MYYVLYIVDSRGEGEPISKHPLKKARKIYPLKAKKYIP